VLRCDDPNLVGAIEPGGKVVAFDLRTQKEVFKAEVDPKHLEKAQGVTLLADRSLYYLAINGPGDQNNNPGGGPWSNFLPTTGVRCVPVNGNVYAYERDSWKLKWRVEVPQQMLVLDSFAELPMLVFTSRYNKLLGNGPQRWWVNGAAVKVIDKRTGKLLDDKPELNNNNGQQFHAYNVDLKAGKVEMVSYNYKVTYFLEGSSALAEAGPGGGKDKPANQPMPPPGGGLRPGGLRLPIQQIER